MAGNQFKLFCLIDGDAASNAFPVKIESNSTVGDLKKAIRDENPNTFSGVDAKDLVSVPLLDDDDNNDSDDDDENNSDDDVAPILLDNVSKLSGIFPEEPPEETIHIIVWLTSSRPSGVDVEVAELRKQLSEVTGSSITVGIIVKPEKRVVLSWSTNIETAALRDLRNEITKLFPQYTHDDYLQIFVYSGQPKPECISNDNDLCRLLKVARTSIKPKWIVSLETPSKSFGNWTFKEVCDEYNLSVATEPESTVLRPFTGGIQSAPLENELQQGTCDLLINEIEARVDSLPLNDGNEATKSMVVASLLVAATRLFKDDLYIMAQRQLSGRRGNGPVDFSIHPRKNHDYILGVTEAKRNDFKQGVAQNIVQLEAALTEKKRERERYDIEEQDPPGEQKAYGIVTNTEKWAFLECTMLEDETISFKMSWLPESLNFGGNWKENARSIFT
ncbi:hypothetical protein EDD11_001152 [Mortierella claussenii]|nr:hypothetical protein EDD11_001152 [Mortierella claussenii]